MCHVSSLVEHLCNSQITDFNSVVLAQKHINCFDISMQNSINMQIAQSNAHFDVKFPDL